MINPLKWYLVFLCIVLSGGYLYYESHKPCTSPITYRLGTFDTTFGISKADFLKDIDQGNTLWSDAIGKPLFMYSPQGTLTINLIYDDRQKATDENKALVADGQKLASLAASVKEQYENLEKQYAQDKADYAALVAVFTEKEQAYSQEVDYWNSRGGAGEAEYTKLNTKRAELVAGQNTLEAKRIALNNLVDQINTFIQKYNLLVNDANTQISMVNQNAGKEFEEGQYDPNINTITIYEFSNNKKLLRVLAHELGHALGLNHNPNPLSIMYALNQATNFVLSKEDIASIKARCNL